MPREVEEEGRGEDDRLETGDTGGVGWCSTGGKERWHALRVLLRGGEGRRGKTRWW